MTTGSDERSKPSGSMTASRLLGLSLIAAMCWLVSGCSFTDIFQTGTGDDDSSRATATSSGDDAERAARMTPEGHRYHFAPRAEFDPNAIEAASSPEERALADLAEQWSDTETVHFGLEIDGETYLDEDGNIQLESAEGDLKRPDQASAEANVGVGFASFDVDLVVIGDDAYMTNFLNGNWERAPGNFDFNPALIFDDEHGISGVVEQLEDPRMTEDTEVDGRAATQISGTVDRSTVHNLVAGALEGDEIGIDLWMDPETHDLLRISLREPDDVDGDPTTWIITFSDHGAAVTIEAPDL